MFVSSNWEPHAWGNSSIPQYLSAGYPSEKLCCVAPSTLINTVVVKKIRNKVRRLRQGVEDCPTGFLDLITKQFSEKPISTISMYSLL